MVVCLKLARQVREKRECDTSLVSSYEKAEPWDEDAAMRIIQDAMRHLADRYVEDADLSVLDPWEGKVQEAYEAEDITGLKTAVQGLVQAGSREFERHDKKR